MGVSIERLRAGLLVGAAALLLILAGFLGYAHYRAHRFLRGLPARLGASITRETDHVTYSQTVGGRTLFTVRAARATQRADGKVMLHDVAIVLYGRKTDRADRISGSEFEYDQAAGVIRATGEVHLDLQAPVQGAGRAAPNSRGPGADPVASAGEGPGRPPAGMIHVRTSGLVFLQKLGVAATDQRIEFELNGTRGSAVGADYSADTGVVVLHSEVAVQGIEHGRPVMLTAAEAQLDRPGQQLVLYRATLRTGAGTERGGDAAPGLLSANGASGGLRQASADRTVIHLAADGHPQRLEASGGVRLAGASGAVPAPPQYGRTMRSCSPQACQTICTTPARPETARWRALPTAQR